MFRSRGEFLQKIEIIFSETEGNGLHNALNEFWNSWSQLSNNPESEPGPGYRLESRVMFCRAVFAACTPSFRGYALKLMVDCLQI
ncbi:MAG: hypothetical protein CM1200mP28_05790 [Deltaproteobacteria bacterium]|nr:MAG: hypothetical protein CM1200mP28_05790 [Deltaproteobacteria bacterium]